MRVKNNYPSINAYKDTFGTFLDAIHEMENSRFPISQIDVNLYDKYILICQDEIYKLALKHPNISIYDISEILQEGYDLGIASATELYELEKFKDLYL